MRNKGVDVNSIKFLMERMEKRYTFNEMEVKVKNLLTEGVGDDIIKSALKVVGKHTSKYVDDIRIIEKQGAGLQGTLKNFDNKFRMIQSADNLRLVLPKLPQAKSLEESIEEFVNTYANLLKKISLDKGFDIDVKVIKDFISGLTPDYPAELISAIGTENLSSLQKVHVRIKELVLVNESLFKLNQIVEFWGKGGGQDIDIRNAIISLIGKDGVESVDDLKKSIKELDELSEFDFELGKDLNGAWRRIKRTLELSTESIDVEIKRSFRNDPAYEISDNWFKSKVQKLVNKNIDNIKISLSKLDKKKINWKNSVIYRNKSDNTIVVIQFKSEKEVRIYKDYLKSNGLNFKDAETMQDAIEQIGEMAKANNRFRKIRNVSIAGLTSSVLLFSLVCPFFKEGKIDPVELALLKTTRPEDAAKEEETWFFKMGRCWGEIFVSVGESVVDIADVAVDNVKFLFQMFEKEICDKLKEICENWECCYTDDCFDKQETCCMECNDETKIELIVEDLIEKFDKLINTLKTIETIIDKLGEDSVNTIKKNIKEDGILSGFLFKDGQPMTLIELIKLTCTKQNVKCVGNKVKEIFTYVSNELNTKDCETLQNEDNIPMKLEELRRFNDAGYLTLNEGEEDKVYINWKVVNPALYGKADSVDQCINIMHNSYEKVILSYCKIQTEDNGEVPIVGSDYTNWCENNGRDPKVVKSLMEYLWVNEVVQLDCTTGEDSISEWFEPTEGRKIWAKGAVYSLFIEHFRPIFPEVTKFSDGWDDAFIYWYDKQKNKCGY